MKRFLLLTILTLTVCFNSCQYDYIYPEIHVYKYWLDFSCSVVAKCNELGYKIADTEFYMIERDKENNDLRKLTKPKNDKDKWIVCEYDAHTVQAYIDVTAWKVDDKGHVDYTKELKIFTVRFDKLLLKEIALQQIILTDSDPHTFDIYVDTGSSNIAVTGVSLNTTSKTLKIGETTTLTPTITPSNATNKNVTWTSSNTSVATVSSTGLVTAKSAGTANITCKTSDGGYTATCKVTVSNEGSSGNESKFWNFSSTAFKSLGTISSTKTIDGLTIAATSSKTVVIDSHSATCDGISFINRLKFGGTGASDARNVNFTVSGACTIEIYACSANSSETRTLKVDYGNFGSTNGYSQSVSGTITKVTANYDGTSSKKVYIYSGNSGINLYGIRVTYK